MSYLDFIKKLITVSPRFGDNELKAATIIKAELDSKNIPFTTQPFTGFVPQITKAELFVDGTEVPCIGSSFVGGEIPGGDNFISNMDSSDGNKYPYVIAYSPLTDNISVTEHYHVPSVTVSRTSIPLLLSATEVHGIVEVNKKEIKSENILVGNQVDPKNIIFAHYDSIIGDGAMDNGAAVTLLMDLTQDKELIKNNLFVFAGNEELTYDTFKHDGYGFRVFEDKYKNLLLSATKVFSIDGIGIGVTTISQTMLKWVLQLKCLDEIKEKVWWMHGANDQNLKYFHTISDTIDNISQEHLTEAKDLLIQRIS